LTWVTRQDPVWRVEYRAARSKVERKLGYVMRRRCGDRPARVGGQSNVGAGFASLAAAVDLARFGVLELSRVAGSGWAVAPS